MKSKTRHYKSSVSREKLIARYERQQERINKFRDTYNNYNRVYYAKAKRRDLMSNTFDRLQNQNPYKMTTTELLQATKDNAQALRTFGGGRSTSGDYLEALTLLQLNNEAYISVQWSDSATDLYEAERLATEQQWVMGDMLYDSLKSLRLTDYQLKRVLSYSDLPSEVKDEVYEALKEVMKGGRK